MKTQTFVNLFLRPLRGRNLYGTFGKRALDITTAALGRLAIVPAPAVLTALATESGVDHVCDSMISLCCYA
jgi:hypothetical protein